MPLSSRMCELSTEEALRDMTKHKKENIILKCVL